MTAANATKTARARKAVRAAARLTAPPGDRWAAVFGRIAVYSFIVALISGVLLLPFFRPSMATVAYHGSYSKLDGAPMSQAYRSVLDISFDVRARLLTRQVHHWSADLFVAAICLRLLRAFFRGRFSGRALPDWLSWVALLPLGMLAAYTGTILPDDGLSGGSLAVVTGVLLSVPVIGTHLVLWIFGGAPPGHQIIGRDYWVHILVLPALAGALLLLSFRPSLRWPRRVRPDPLLPFTCAVLVLLGTIAQINPVWLIGPYQPGSRRAGCCRPRQPTWRTAPRPAWPASRSTGCCGPRQPTTRSPTTCRSLSTRSPGYSGCSCWPGRRWRSCSPGSSATRWPTSDATRNCTAGKPGGS